MDIIDKPNVQAVNGRDEEDETGGVANANTKVKEMYGFEFNSATLSRNNTTLMELGLIKLVETQEDRRYKEVKLIAPKGVNVKKLMYQSGERVWKYK